MTLSEEDRGELLDEVFSYIESGNAGMDELRMFLAERAKEAGDRETYLKYYFSQKTDPLTF
ncbi:hypothetical protein [Desulfobacterium sp. N47]